MRDVIFLILPEVEILDFAGPLQALSEANRGKERYRIRLCSPSESVRSHQGVTLSGLAALPESVGNDSLVIVPGMPYHATQKIDREVTRWLTAAANGGAHVASVCTGAFALGEAGLLDGRQCTTHWSRTGELARRYPQARVLEDRLFVSDGNMTTSAGIASGIDMALSFIEQTDGPIMAAEVAKEMVVYLRRDGAEEQRSVYLEYRTHIHPGVHRVQDFIVQNPARRATLEELAEVAGMSARSLTRTFRASTGISVHAFTTKIRAALARTLLNDPSLTREAVAQRSGFTTARQLRRVLTAG